MPYNMLTAAVQKASDAGREPLQAHRVHQYGNPAGRLLIRPPPASCSQSLHPSGIRLHEVVLNPVRKLVTIANYGTGSRKYLEAVIAEFRRMPGPLDIVVVSNIPKDLGPDVEVRVGLPARNPWTLPFAHKPVFAERVDHYDLFIYTEDDVPITRRNVEAFLDATRHLAYDELAGFLRTERTPDGQVWFPDVHGCFRWDATSVRTRGPYRCAYFTNEHAGCYMLTQDQLRRALQSKGFLVAPHEGRYGWPESAATDVYTRCGFRKMICISHLDDFCVPHLPNKYVGRMGLQARYVHQQIEALTDQDGSHRKKSWITDETTLRKLRWSKNRYMLPQLTVLEMLPKDVRSVLSIGCDLGATERELVARGVEVVGIPTDSITASCAASGGVEIVDKDLKEALASLCHRRFDAVLCLDVLHLTPDPPGLCVQVKALLRDRGTFIVSTPNTGHLGALIRRILGQQGYRNVGDYSKAGVHWVTERILRRMFRRAGLQVSRVERSLTDRWRGWTRFTGGFGETFVASELFVSGTTKT